MTFWLGKFYQLTFIWDHCTEEPGRLQSMGSQRVGHNWATSFYCTPGLRSKFPDLRGCCCGPREASIPFYLLIGYLLPSRVNQENGKILKVLPITYFALWGLSKPAWCDSWGHKESDTTERLNWTERNQRIVTGNRWPLQCFIGNRSYWKLWSFVWVKDGEGNGTPLQYSCLENPMAGGAW